MRITEFDVLLALDYYSQLTPEARVTSDQSIKIPCPFHSESIPSLSVDIAKGLLYCFGCGWKGDIIQFVADYEKTDRLSAMQKLYRIAKGDKRLKPKKAIAQQSSGSMLEDAFLQYDSAVKPNWNLLADNYLIAQRHFKPATLTHFDVRLETGSNDYPILIPIYDNGRFCGYLRRRIDKQSDAKYINSKGFAKLETIAGEYKPGIVLVTEGVLDMMRAWEYGYHNVACLFGWKASEAQLAKLHAHTDFIISALDNDAPGKRGHRLLKQNFARVIRFPFTSFTRDIKDIGDMTRQEFRNAMQTIKAQVKQ